MARCCGGSQGCSCRVVPGAGIAVSGSGQATDPFIITALVADFSPALIAQQTSSVRMDVSGGGTADDPFIIASHVTVGLTNLADVDDASGPALGEVPVFNGSHWEFAPPPTVPPGLVNASAGIVGDGTLAEPLRVAVSSTATTATSGLAIYVDSAGQLRAVPPAVATVAWTSITGKPTTFPPASHRHAWADVNIPTYHTLDGRMLLDGDAPPNPWQGNDGDWFVEW